MVARARSIHEMHFAASLEPCPKCGTRIDAQQLSLAGNDEAWALTGNCPRCATPRAFTFVTYGDPLTAPAPRDELAGPAPSEIISPAQWIAEIDRLIPLVRPDPTKLEIDEWKASRDANKRLLVCLNELRKFIPDGASEIPADKLSDAERVDRKARPERFQRAWIETEREQCLALRARHVADLPRIEKLERGGGSGPKAHTREIELDRDALRAHESWIKAGQRGKGRLVLVGTQATGVRLTGVELVGAKLDEVDLSGADLSFANLDDAELRGVRFTGAKLESLSLRGAQIEAGSFAGAQLTLAKLDDATIEGTSFGDAQLDRSQWRGARVVRADLDGATFGNAELDGATFLRCTFAGASFAPIAHLPEPTTRETRFEDCDLRDTNWEGRDLRGAVFVRCKVDSLQGRPLAIDDIVIEDPDLSTAGDGSDLGTPEDMLAMWFPERYPTN